MIINIIASHFLHQRYTPDLKYQEQRADLPIIGFMGGPSNEVFARATSLGFPVHLVPFFKVQEVTGLGSKETPEIRSEKLAGVWREQNVPFYFAKPAKENIALIRELTRNRLSIQEFRKKAQLQFYASLRERMRFLLPPEAEELVMLIYKLGKEMFKNKELQTQVEKGLVELEAKLPKEKKKEVMAIMRHFANPRFIIDTKKDEEEEERQIARLLSAVPIYGILTDKQALWRVMGFGPAIGGATISEIDDIRRFPHAGALRAYARFHIAENGFPRRVKGQESSWNFYLNRAMWIWTSDQLHRWKDAVWHDYWLSRKAAVWHDYWLSRKAVEFKEHPEVKPREVTDGKGRKKIIYDFSLKHLDSRARRWTGSQLFQCIYFLWNALELGEDPKKNS